MAKVSIFMRDTLPRSGAARPRVGAGVLDYTDCFLVTVDSTGGRDRRTPTTMSTAAASPNVARIPGGDFLMGAADAEEDERPIHRVFVSEFFIGRFPVTNDDYARFVRATGHSAPAVRELPLVAGGGREALFRDMAAPYEWHGDQPPAGHGGHPVVLVTCDDAAAYCRWLSDELGRIVRLPTEAEWERAARAGVDGLRYPWGNEIDPSRCNFLTDGALKRQRGTRPTGTYPPNAYGLYDVCGNVWEWVADWYTPTTTGSARCAIHADPNRARCASSAEDRG
jgi:formylglycine-generating enzyme